MGPGPKEETQNNTSNNKKALTAVELAELVINTTSTLIPAVAELEGDQEIKQKIIQALTLLQKRAIDYTIAAAKRSQMYQRRNNYWRRGRSWRAGPGRR